MRARDSLLLVLWLCQLAPQRARAQSASAASSQPGSAVAGSVSPGALSPGVSSLLRDPSGEPPFDNNKARLADGDLQLLTQNGYRLQADGAVLPPRNDAPVAKSEMQWLLQELSGRQRLKALLQLNLIFNRYGYKNLPDSPLADVRKISRQNWKLLPRDIRSDLRRYFTAYELDAMNQGLPAPRPSSLWVAAELPQLAAVPSMPTATFIAPPPAAPAASPATAAISAAPPAPSASAASAPARAATRAFALAEPDGQAKLQAITSAQAPATQAAPSRAAAASAEPRAAASVAAPEAPPVQAALSSPPAPVAAAGVAVPAAAAAPVPVPAAPAPAMPAPASAAAQAKLPEAPAVGEYPEVSREAFDKFMADAPYGHEASELLKLLSLHAPEDVRRPALGALMRFLPQIVIDPARAGAELRAAARKLNEDPYQPAAALIVLDRGPLILRERKFIFSAETFLMPGGQESFSDSGVSPPPLQAASRQTPPLFEKNSDWGRLECYPDGSERLLFSKEELAGTLLHQLLKLDARLRRWDSDPYRTELRSRSAQFRFYFKLKQDTGKEPPLSLDLQTEYRDWLDKPEDFMDFVLQALSSPKADQALSSLSGTLEQRSAWSRRHDLKVFSGAGLALSDDARKSLSGPAPAAPDLSEPNAGLQRELQALGESSSISAIWLSEEQRFREDLNAKH